MTSNTAEYMRQYRQEHRDAIRAKDREYRQANLERLRAEARAYAVANPAEAAERHRNWFNGLRAAVFGHYGERCACCGATDDLVIDHVNGNGEEHRSDLFGHRPRWNGKTASTASFYRWLVSSGFPPGFQTLCRPCNSSKRRGTKCRLQHQEVRHQ
jgi:hypothetical protein